MRLILVLVGSFAVLSVSSVVAADSPAKSREFLFTYFATVNDVAPGTKVRVWLPVPPTDADQTARIVRQDLPASGQFGTEPKYGNRVLYTQFPVPREGKASLSVVYRVKREEVKSDVKNRKMTREEVEQFLKPDARVPITGKPLTLLEGKTLPMDQMKLGRMFYDLVNTHMSYSKQGTGWGQGDSEWACDSRYGNCSDFHSLFISLARSQRIPAKFEMGFPLPEKHGSGEIAGYHCWARFKPEGRGWIPVDISEANKVRDKSPETVEYYFGNLTENRVAFSVGRDLTLVPPQDGPALNFFVYPYVEVDGQPLAAENLRRKFEFRDLDGEN